MRTTIFPSTSKSPATSPANLLSVNLAFEVSLDDMDQDKVYSAVFDLLASDGGLRLQRENVDLAFSKGLDNDEENNKFI